MYFKMDLDGILVQIRITGYKPYSKEDWDEKWCKTDFSFVSDPWLDYHKEGDEVFLSCEVRQLADLFERLLNDKLNEVTEFNCMEPDFSFILTPKRDLRSDPNVTYLPKGYEIEDICAEWRISFWHNGLTENYLSVSLDRADIENFKNYLNLVSGKASKTDPAIVAMLRAGILQE